MVEAHFGSRADGYKIILWDGFVRDVLFRHRRYANRQESHERLMAEHLYYRGKKLERHDRPEKPVRRSTPTHIWVLGYDGWIGHESRLFQAIRGPAEPPDPAQWNEYRLIIAGYGPTVPPGGDWGAQWNKLRLRIGMYRMQPHSNRSEFRNHACRLLEPMHEAFLGTRAPPSIILDQLDVPYEFIGDH